MAGCPAGHLWYISFILVGGSILVVRFLFALRAGYRDGMLMLRDTSITVRDLSPKNLVSIYWLVGTALSCFLAALVGLTPDILIGWTIHLPHPALVFFSTIAAILLSLAGTGCDAGGRLVRRHRHHRLHLVLPENGRAAHLLIDVADRLFASMGLC